MWSGRLVALLALAAAASCAPDQPLVSACEAAQLRQGAHVRVRATGIFGRHGAALVDPVCPDDVLGWTVSKVFWRSLEHRRLNDLVSHEETCGLRNIELEVTGTLIRKEDYLDIAVERLHDARPIGAPEPSRPAGCDALRP